VTNRVTNLGSPVPHVAVFQREDELEHILETIVRIGRCP